MTSTLSQDGPAMSCANRYTYIACLVETVLNRLPKLRSRIVATAGGFGQNLGRTRAAEAAERRGFPHLTLASELSQSCCDALDAKRTSEPSRI